MAIFDAYLVVDWSAAARPRQGADSIWYGLYERGRRGLRACALANPSTRSEALERLAEILARLATRGRRTLAGFDFPNAYPAGFARRAGFPGTPWRAVWDGIAELVEDRPDNANNRFEVAAGLNERISGADFPFWGCPAGRAGPRLSARKVDRHAAEGLAERRLAEAWVPRAQPCWKLAYTGSVGSQALLGIPVQRALRDDSRLRDQTLVWPFETGLRPPPEGDWRVVLAEVYPSLAPIALGHGPVKDARQVTATCRLLARRDEAGQLAVDLAGPPELDSRARKIVEREEGWLLGAGTFPATRRAGGEAYLAEPAAIQAQSFARVREAARLEAPTAGLDRIAERVVHATAMPELADRLVGSDDFVQAAIRALGAGAPILVDCEMLARGITARRLPSGCEVHCSLNDPRVPGLARRRATTRSAAALELWRARLEGGVVAIGNAPTALFHLLAMLRAGAPRPAAIVALPVGFVGAAAAKAALMAESHGVPYLTLPGRLGGSAMAAAAVNALLGLAGEGIE